mmetsp:Transcript_108975/g.188653  ORF Transcript_108975/g.188653 Transcript_108975/m.188653 type:complete len:323 (-) Transcript_108975:949-1917(-)
MACRLQSGGQGLPAAVRAGHPAAPEHGRDPQQLGRPQAGRRSALAAARGQLRGLGRAGGPVPQGHGDPRLRADRPPGEGCARGGSDGPHVDGDRPGPGPPGGQEAAHQRQRDLPGHPRPGEEGQEADRPRVLPGPVAAGVHLRERQGQGRPEPGARRGWGLLPAERLPVLRPRPGGGGGGPDSQRGVPGAGGLLLRRPLHLAPEAEHSRVHLHQRGHWGGPGLHVLAGHRGQGLEDRQRERWRGDQGERQAGQEPLLQVHLRGRRVPRCSGPRRGARGVGSDIGHPRAGGRRQVRKGGPLSRPCRIPTEPPGVALTSLAHSL